MLNKLNPEALTGTNDDESKTMFRYDNFTAPNMFHLVDSNSSLWVLKAVSEGERASLTIDSYNDVFAKSYNYDDFVANFKRIKDNDFAILVDKNKILGFARIGRITISLGKKILRRCPICKVTTIDTRKTKHPKYRCNKGHEFDILEESTKEVRKYQASFSTFIATDKQNDLLQLRPYYINGYNQNMSMQLLSFEALSLFPHFSDLHFQKKPHTLLAEEGYEANDESYICTGIDEREISHRAIRVRRGQEHFRKELLKRFSRTCVITGCKIVDILEAAHIKPYKGENDNHINNGLLLRTDIHTLFDLNLLAIHPETLVIHFHTRVINEYDEFHLKRLTNTSSHLLAKECLKVRWEIFETNNSIMK